MAREVTAASGREFFISYAREDEETLVKPLADAFLARGVSFWLDRKDLRPERSFEDDIHRGLLTARHAVVIISKSFLEKDWPKRELDILLTLEAVDQRRKIVTVRHEMTQSELERLAPQIAQRTVISSDSGHVAVCDRVIELSLEYELMPQQPDEFQAGTAVFPTFYAKGIFTCPYPNCTWAPDPSLDRLGLADQGRPFTMKRRQEDWYVTCTSCGSNVFGPVGKDHARWLLTFLRVIIYALQESPYLNTSLFSKPYLALMEKERSLTRGELSSAARSERGEEWLAARDTYAGEIELAMQMGQIDRSQYDELSQTNRRHGEEFRNSWAKKNKGDWSERLRRLVHPAPPAQPIASAADDEALFPAAERDRIRRDISTLLTLPPGVRGELSADLRERIEKFVSALTPLQERTDHPRAQLYLGCLFYWNCVRTVTAGTDAERAVMNQAPFNSVIGVIAGYFPTAEYFLDRYRAMGVGGPAEQELLYEVESWMKAIRAQLRVNAEMRKWTRSE